MTDHPTHQPTAAAPFWPAALRRTDAATYCGHSAGHFSMLAYIHPAAMLMA